MDAPYERSRLPWMLRYVHGARAASRARELVIRATHRHCEVRFEGPVILGPGFSLYIPERGTLVVGAGCEFRRGFVCEIWGDGAVRIGAGTVFTSHALLQCSTSIDIGERCMFGQSTLIVDGNHRFRDLDRPMLEQGYDFTPVCIGDDVTVTTKCTIVGTTIGDRAVIGAHAFVNRPVPAYTVAVGSPARPIESFGPTPPPTVETDP